jgi:hypothetical protein
MTFFYYYYTHEISPFFSFFIYLFYNKIYCLSAIGFAWIVMDLIRISRRGLLFSSTGSFSKASKVESAPSMTLHFLHLDIK